MLVGVIARHLARNHSHDLRVGPARWVELGGLAPKVNRSCDARGATDNLARIPRAFGPLGAATWAVRRWLGLLGAVVWR